MNSISWRGAAAVLLLGCAIRAHAMPVTVQTHSKTLTDVGSGTFMGRTFVNNWNWAPADPNNGSLTSVVLDIWVQATVSIHEVNPFFTPPITYTWTPVFTLNSWLNGYPGMGSFNAQPATVTGLPVTLAPGQSTFFNATQTFHLFAIYTAPQQLAGFSGSSLAPFALDISVNALGGDYGGYANQYSFSASMTYNTIPDFISSGAWLAILMAGLFVATRPRKQLV